MHGERIGYHHFLCESDANTVMPTAYRSTRGGVVARENCGMTSPKCTIGPAINCGKNITNNAKSMNVGFDFVPSCRRETRPSEM